MKVLSIALSFLLIFVSLAIFGCKSSSDNFPNTNASCDEKINFIANYVKDKNDCKKDSDCVALWGVGGEDCDGLYWIEVPKPGTSSYDEFNQDGYIPAIRKSEVNERISSLTNYDLTEECCGGDPSDFGNHFFCTGLLMDAAEITIGARCVSGKCQGVVDDPEEYCGPDFFDDGGIDGGVIRFTESTIDDDVIVTDSSTGLTWQKEYVIGKDWQAAIDYCSELSYAGYNDWRLPDKEELEALVVEDFYSPASSFPDMPSEWFWSSSTYDYDTLAAWYVDFIYGEARYYNKIGRYDARCVRKDSIDGGSTDIGKDGGLGGNGGSDSGL